MAEIPQFPTPVSILQKLTDSLTNNALLSSLLSVVHLPKYARINLLKVDVPLVIAAFKEDGYVLSNDGTMDRDNFSIDPILPDVLRFHPLAPLTTHPLYHNSHIILQDKVRICQIYTVWVCIRL